VSARGEELRRRLEREPGSRLFAQYAEELRREGDAAEAIRVCREGLERHPNYASARITLGRALLDSGEIPGARGEFEAVLAQSPENILASRYLGECLERSGDLAGATARYEATLAQAPGDEFSRERVAELRAAADPGVGASGASGGQSDVGGEAKADDAWAVSAPGASDGGAEEFPTAIEEEEFELVPQRPATGRPELTFRPLVEEAVPYQAEATATRPMTESELAGLKRAARANETKASGGEDEPLVSATLADLYRRQGAPERALEMYRELLGRDPGNREVASAVSELEREIEDRAVAGQQGRRDRVVARLQAFGAGVRRAADSARGGA
jgi:tetratricopeptide (TPR) repeat protein